jgi:predicted DNA-binding transcriptional regulator YafY
MDKKVPPEIKQNQVVSIVYTNWEGKVGIRHILPQKMWYGKTEWHKEEQWLLTAWDIDKDAERTYAMKDIHHWYTEGND